MSVALEEMPEPNEPFRKVGLSYVWDHPEYPIRMTADDIRVGYGGELVAEVLVEDTRFDKPKYIALTIVRLLDLQKRRTFAMDVAENCGQEQALRKVPWRPVIELFCMSVVRRFREGEPTQHIAEIAAPSKQKDLIARVLPAGKPTLWYGPQGTGKGWLCCNAAVCVSTGMDFAGLKVAAKVPVLYLDWEDNEETFHDRINVVLNGHNYSGELPGIHYLKMRGTLPRQIPRIMREIAEKHIGLVIIDSVGLAMGANTGGSYEDQAIQFFEAIRYLEPAAALLVDHVTGSSVSNGTVAGKAFGSIYKMAEARAAWEIRKEQDTDSDEQIVGLHHTKHNHTRKYPSFAIKIAFEIEPEDERLVRVTLAQTDIKQTAELVKQLSQKEQILAFLGQEGASSTAEIADAVDCKDDVARSQLNGLRKKKLVTKLPDGRWGLAEQEPKTPPYLKPLP